MARICKVLIVENDDYIRELLEEVFEEEGFLFSSVETGAEMEDQLDEDDFDIVMIDITQPGEKDGYALADIAHQQGCGVILTTGDHPPIRAAPDSAAVTPTLKPFRMHDLMTLVEQIMTIASMECVRRKRRDGSYFPDRGE